jgi:hypothetical protein
MIKGYNYNRSIGNPFAVPFTQRIKERKKEYDNIQPFLLKI